MPGEGRRVGLGRSLLVGFYEPDGDGLALRYAGQGRDRLHRGDAARPRPHAARSSERTSRRSPGASRRRTAVFVEPELVAEVEFREWTQARTLRAPSFKGLRDDRDAATGEVRDRAAPDDAGAGESTRMRVSAKADYAVRALVELAAGDEGDADQGRGDLDRAGDPDAVPREHPLRAPPRRAGAEPPRRRGRLLAQPTSAGGHGRRRDPRRRGPAGERARRAAPEELAYTGSAEPLARVWIALRANVRAVLEHVTLADVVAGELPPDVDSILGPRREAPPAG